MNKKYLSVVMGAVVLFEAGCVRSEQTSVLAAPPTAAAAVGTTTKSSAHVASQEWIETMQCKGVDYQLKSQCAASGSDMELNACSSQQLTVSHAGKSRVIDLPNPLPKDRANLELEGLFVVQWGCVEVGSRGYAVLYYSKGGGNAEGSENVEFYDRTGDLVNVSSPDWKEMNRKWDGTLKSVKSIMPLDGAE